MLVPLTVHISLVNVRKGICLLVTINDNILLKPTRILRIYFIYKSTYISIVEAILMIALLFVFGNFTNLFYT